MRFQPLRPWINGFNSVTPEIFYGQKDPDLSKAQSQSVSINLYPITFHILQ